MDPKVLIVGIGSAIVGTVATLGGILGFIERVLDMWDRSKGLIGRLQRKRPAPLPTSTAGQVANPSGAGTQQAPAPVTLPPLSTPVPAPPQAPTPTATLPKPRRRIVTHPAIALGAGVVTVGTVVLIATVSSGSTPPAPLGILGLVEIPVWIACIVQTIQLRRWGWLISVAVLPPYGWLAYGLFGPTEKRQPRAK